MPDANYIVTATPIWEDVDGQPAIDAGDTLMVQAEQTADCFYVSLIDSSGTDDFYNPTPVSFNWIAIEPN